MRKRTKSRELALQLLYELDIRKEPLADLLNDFWETHNLKKATDKKVEEFANELAGGVVKCIDDIDKIIISYAKNWQLKRMAVIDRNIIRMGCFELLYVDDIPPKVSINEAVELAKKYGDTESSKFVNGILDRVHKELAQKKDK